MLLFGDLCTGYAWKYGQWASWQLFFDELALHYKLKPLHMTQELIPRIEEFSLYEETLYYFYLRSVPTRDSAFSFMHGSYVLWNIRQSSLWLSPNADNAVNGVKAGLHALAMPLTHFLVLLTVVLSLFKGLRLVIWVPLDTYTSGAYQWTHFRKYPTQASFDAMVHLPAYVEERFLGEHCPTAASLGDHAAHRAWLKPPGKFYNLAMLYLQDLFGTKDPVEALVRGSMLHEGSSLGQRLASREHFRRLWGSREREELWSFIYRRRRGPAAKLPYALKDYPMAFRLSDPAEAKYAGKTEEVVAFMDWLEAYNEDLEKGTQNAVFPERFDVRVFYQMKQLLGLDLWSFLVHHKVDFMH